MPVSQVHFHPPKRTLLKDIRTIHEIVHTKSVLFVCFCLFVVCGFFS